MNIIHLAAAAAALAGAPDAEAAVTDRTPDVTTAVVVQGQGRGQGQEGRKQPAERGNSGKGQANRGERPAQRGQGQAKQSQGQGQANRPAASRGSGQGQGQANRPSQAAPGDRGRGNAPGSAARGASAARGVSERGRAAGRAGRLSTAELRSRVEALPPGLRRLSNSDRKHERMVAGATALGTAYGLRPDAVRVRSEGDRVRLMNSRDELLLDIDERRAREMGNWDLRMLGDQRPRSNSPAFCRSGAGHPVWGREWCIDKGFGLGGSDVLWSRGRIDDVVYRRTRDRDRLDRGGLIDVLGDVVFGRLALHAVSAGYDRPLTGTWVAEPNAPRILRVHAGDDAVAEFVDLDRDDRPEVLYVVHRR